MYSAARDWCRANPDARARLTRQQQSDYRRIARLGDARGLRLDELGASYRLLRWVAGPGDAGAVLREQRYLAAVMALEAAEREVRPLSEQTFRELRAAYPLPDRPRGRGAFSRASLALAVVS